MQKNNRSFWNWVKNEQEESHVRELHINGAIAEESWYDDDVTPKLFREELLSGEGDIVLFLNSPGGDVFAASQIYTMLMEYRGNVTVKIAYAREVRQEQKDFLTEQGIKNLY